MNKVRSNYTEILADLANSNALSTFIKDVTGDTLMLVKDSNDLSKDILNSEYALSQVNKRVLRTLFRFQLVQL